MPLGHLEHPGLLLETPCLKWKAEIFASLKTNGDALKLDDRKLQDMGQVFVPCIICLAGLNAGGSLSCFICPNQVVGFQQATVGPC